MKSFLAIAAALAMFGLSGSSAEAGGVRLYVGGHGGYGHPGFGYSSCGPRYYSYPRYRSNYGHVWHNTGHYDYHPGGYVRHRNHFDYVPGHYDYHHTGHWDHIGHYGHGFHH